MFVRFRRQYRRLNVSLIETRRVAGKIKTEHIAALGSVSTAEPPPTRDRVAFYRDLKERLDRLMNRIDARQRKAIVSAIVARIPVPSKDEILAMQTAEADYDVDFWRKAVDDFREGGTFTVLQRRVLATVQQKIDDNLAFAKIAETCAAEAAERADQLKRGEAVRPEGDQIRARTKQLAVAMLAKEAYPQKIG